MIPTHSCTDASGKMIGMVNNITEAHIAGDRTIVEKDIDVRKGVVTCALMTCSQFPTPLQKAAIRTCGIDLTSAHFMPFGVGIIFGRQDTATLCLRRGKHNETNAFSD